MGFGLYAYLDLAVAAALMKSDAAKTCLREVMAMLSGLSRYLERKKGEGLGIMVFDGLTAKARVVLAGSLSRSADPAGRRPIDDSPRTRPG